MTKNNAEQSFVRRWVYAISTVFVNDYGFAESARIGRKYLEEAVSILEREPLVRKHARQARDLRERADQLAKECVRLEEYDQERQTFKTRTTNDVREWVVKQVVRNVSRGYIVEYHFLIAHKIRRFHSEVADVLASVFRKEDGYAYGPTR